VRKHLVAEWIKDNASDIVPRLNSDDDDDDSNDDDVKDEDKAQLEQDAEEPDSDSTGENS